MDNKEYEDNYINFLISRDSQEFSNFFKESNIEKSSNKFTITKNSNAGDKYDPIGKYDWVYLMQDKLAMQLIASIKSNDEYIEFFEKLALDQKDYLVDIGSKFHTANMFSALFLDRTYYVELSRTINLPHINLMIIAAEAQSLPFKDHSVPFVTSLHAIEHFGLGRYGDDIDYYGDIKGMKEVSRVLMPGGFFITSVPTTAGPSRISYHTERVYNPSDFDEIMTSLGFEKINSKNVLGNIRILSTNEENDGLLDENNDFKYRKEAGMFIIPYAEMRIDWSVDRLAEAENFGVGHSAYLSAWRKI